MFISDALKQGKNILVHCAMGRSRSATLVIVYLMLTKKVNLREAYGYVKERRDIIKINITYAK